MHRGLAIPCSWLLAGLCACSSSSGGGTAPGADGGDTGGGTSCGPSAPQTLASFSAQGSTFVDGTAPGTVFDGPSTRIQLQSMGGTCADQTSSHGCPGTVALLLALATTDASGHSRSITAPGTFTVVVAKTSVTPNGMFAMVDFQALCVTESSPSEQATAGTVTVTAVDASHVAGTYDLTFGTDHATGSFDATSCTGLRWGASLLCP